jgi:hypothetical protein
MGKGRSIKNLDSKNFIYVLQLVLAGSSLARKLIEEKQISPGREPDWLSMHSRLNTERSRNPFHFPNHDYLEAISVDASTTSQGDIATGKSSLVTVDVKDKLQHIFFDENPDQKALFLAFCRVKSEFQEAVYGPLGSELQLENENAYHNISQCLEHHTLCAYVATCAADYNLLYEKLRVDLDFVINIHRITPGMMLAQYDEGELSPEALEIDTAYVTSDPVRMVFRMNATTSDDMGQERVPLYPRTQDKGPESVTQNEGAQTEVSKQIEEDGEGDADKDTADVHAISPMLKLQLVWERLRFDPLKCISKFSEFVRSQSQQTLDDSTPGSAWEVVQQFNKREKPSRQLLGHNQCQCPGQCLHIPSMPEIPLTPCLLGLNNKTGLKGLLMGWLNSDVMSAFRTMMLRDLPNAAGGGPQCYVTDNYFFTSSIAKGKNYWKKELSDRIILSDQAFEAWTGSFSVLHAKNHLFDYSAGMVPTPTSHRRRKATVNIFDKALFSGVFIPINIENHHYVGAVVCHADKTIYMLDWLSLNDATYYRQRNLIFHGRMVQHFLEEVFQLTHPGTHLDSYKIELPLPNALQRDSISCGVYLLVAMWQIVVSSAAGESVTECISKLPQLLACTDIDVARHWISLCILNQKILHEEPFILTE